MQEKAFAKFAGGYDKLDGGFPSLAWLALTGCEDQQVSSRCSRALPALKKVNPAEGGPTTSGTGPAGPRRSKGPWSSFEVPTGPLLELVC